ncbi:helix-turn-helix transcriptional regulator [Bernardetia sp. Wsw4-3y2]|uniref:helix-turn-helix transcriptional regulator n=1 Tax=Bernardetia sp. Wsw4-3y2 TaxID=3127471 RepID=UPI0030D320E8
MNKEKLQPIRFKEARDYTDMTQTDIENIIGLSRTSISHHESKFVPKPNVHYVLFLAEKGINPQWLICNSEEMLSSKASNNISVKEVEELKKENISLKNELNALRKEMKEQSQDFLAMIHRLSGKQSGHKHAANQNYKKNSFDLAYAPATIN